LETFLETERHDHNEETAISRRLDRTIMSDHDLGMGSERVRKLLVEAAELPAAERAELVHELARTLPRGDESDEFDVDYDELDRRMGSVRNGSAVLVPWEEARKDLLGR
jgi:hypothetical protein